MRLRRYPSMILAVLMAASGAGARAAGQGDGDESFVVIRAGRVITLAGPDLTDAEIILAGGEIRLVGQDLDPPPGARVIDARREVVMPGLIHPRSRWQLPRYSRSGIHGDRSAEAEVFWSELDLEPLVAAGFTAVCFYPEGTGIPGAGVIYRTAGPESERKLGTPYLRITMSQPGRDKKVLRDAIVKARKEIEKVEKARKEWEAKQKKAQEEKKEEDEKKEGEEKAPAARAGRASEGGPKPPDKEAEGAEKKPEVFTPPAIDPAVLPLVQWLRDKKGKPLLFELARASDFRHLEQVLEKTAELPGDLFYLQAGSSPDYHYVIDDLARRKATVLVVPAIGNLPYTVTRYNLAGELARAGCRVVLVPARDSAAELVRLRPRLAELVRAGLPREEALKAVSRYPAEVLGVGDRLGTIEPGKDGDLIFLDGDPLAPATRVTRTMTLGQIVWEAPQEP